MLKSLRDSKNLRTFAAKFGPSPGFTSAKSELSAFSLHGTCSPKA